MRGKGQPRELYFTGTLPCVTSTGVVVP